MSRRASGRAGSGSGLAVRSRAHVRASRPEGRRLRGIVLLAAIVATIALGSDAGGVVAMASAGEKRPAAASAVRSPAGWTPTALHAGDDLATKIAASTVGCAEYAPSPFDAFATDLKERGLPVPAAMSQCFAADREDLTFELFADERHEEEFVAAKMAVLCKAAAKAGMAFALTYVDGPGWIIEPDEKTTADALARLLGGTSRQRPCG
jgi:hypothetical protein